MVSRQTQSADAKSAAYQQALDENNNSLYRLIFSSIGR